ncbi:Initiation-specific alpha-1,6-mannosyltransferase [Lachnellula arida]|uniref:Initiation-specific alpha-1,6-mannosyltransferase n=1 Tax=Lachnellula arida TaxID=1316785 RepID=A0A8T9BR14_9HELO|nr:Initiation-specific alpha-1,6-mannosyltransferase [Lachnellula arida]
MRKRRRRVTAADTPIPIPAFALLFSPAFDFTTAEADAVTALLDVVVLVPDPVEVAAVEEAGIWSDLDVSCGGTPIRDWIPEEYKKNANLVVGWEFQTIDEQHMREFTTWMIMSKPGLRHMSMVINDTLEALHEKAKEHQVPISGLTMDIVGDIVWLTGPMAMSKSIIKSLGIEKDNINYGTTPYVFEPQLFDDVLVLPGYSFSASIQHYKDYEHPGPALVTHHYAGSWKNSNGGEAGDPVP